MEGLDLPDDFMKNMGSGLASNVLTVGMLAIILCIRNCSKRKFKHSECKSCCFAVSLDEQSESSKDEESEDEKEEDIENPTEKKKKKKKKKKRKDSTSEI